MVLPFKALQVAFSKKTKKELVCCNFTQLKTPTWETKQIPILNNKTMLIIYHKVKRRYFWNFKPTFKCVVVKYLLHLWLYFTTTTTYSWIFFYLLEMRIYIQHYWGLPQKCSIKCQKREARGKLNCKKGPFQLKLLLADLISLWDCHDDIDILLGVLFFPYFIPWLIFRVGKRTLRFLLKKCI